MEVPERVSNALDRTLAALREELPPARWVSGANRHLTLAFLGTVEARDLKELDVALAPVFAARRAFELELGDRGSFPAGRPGRVVWVGFRPSKALDQLQQAVVEACRERGFDIERRPFSPHLTLARCRTPWPRGACDAWRKDLPARTDLATRGGVFTVTRGCLFESVHGPGGVHYEMVRSYPLRMPARDSVSDAQGGE